MADEDNLLDEGLALQEALRLIEDLINRLDVLSNEDDVGALLLRLDVLKRMFVVLNVDDLLSDDVNCAYTALTSIQNNVERRGQRPTQCGRPLIDINENQVIYLLDQGFKVSQICNILGVRKRTLERRMQSLGLSVRGKQYYSSLSIQYAKIISMVGYCHLMG
jgi:DNA-binding NtrC family response regulator